MAQDVIMREIPGNGGQGCLRADTLSDGSRRSMSRA
jgi:hypothetical protein